MPREINLTIEDVFVVPRTPAEHVVAGIWSEVLKMERVGIHNNFFELGGNSLLATQILQRIRDALKVEVPLRWFFASATVTELAELIDTMRWAVGQRPDDASSRSAEEGTL